MKDIDVKTFVEKFKEERNKKIVAEYIKLRDEYSLSETRICQILSPKFGVCKSTIRNIMRGI